MNANAELWMNFIIVSHTSLLSVVFKGSVNFDDDDESWERFLDIQQWLFAIWGQFIKKNCRLLTCRQYCVFKGNKSSVVPILTWMRMSRGWIWFFQFLLDSEKTDYLDGVVSNDQFSPCFTIDSKLFRVFYNTWDFFLCFNCQSLSSNACHEYYKT